MIERLKESRGAAFGFKVVGRISGDEVTAFEPQIAFLIKERKERPIGILADLSQMEGADWEHIGMRCVFSRNTPTISREWRWSVRTNGKKWWLCFSPEPLFFRPRLAISQLQRSLLPGTGSDRARMLITSPYEECISVQVSLRTTFLSTRICKTASEDIFDVILAAQNLAPARMWGR